LHEKSEAQVLLERVKVVHDLNMSLLDNLQAILMWIIQYAQETGTSIPRMDTLYRLMRETQRIGQEMESPLVPEHHFFEPLDKLTKNL
jgi:hypothetical protein